MTTVLDLERAILSYADELDKAERGQSQECSEETPLLQTQYCPEPSGTAATVSSEEVIQDGGLRWPRASTSWAESAVVSIDTGPIIVVRYGRTFFVRVWRRSAESIIVGLEIGAMHTTELAKHCIAFIVGVLGYSVPAVLKSLLVLLPFWAMLGAFIYLFRYSLDESKPGVRS